ncbi:hypothetical protein PG984_011498 [Apiospora sp. TS-2023a]
MADNNPGPQTSGELKYRPTRLHNRRKRARRILNRILAASATFTALAADKQDLIRQGYEEVIRHHIDDFMDHTPPRTLYPYDQAVLAAVKSVVYWNPDVIGWNEDDWNIPLEEDNEDA